MKSKRSGTYIVGFAGVGPLFESMALDELRDVTEFAVIMRRYE